MVAVNGQPPPPINRALGKGGWLKRQKLLDNAQALDPLSLSETAAHFFWGSTNLIYRSGTLGLTNPTAYIQTDSPNGREKHGTPASDKPNQQETNRNRTPKSMKMIMSALNARATVSPACNAAYGTPPALTTTRRIPIVASTSRQAMAPLKMLDQTHHGPK